MDSSQSTSGREIAVHGSRIVGVVSCLPSREVENAHFLSQFEASDIEDVVKMIGVRTRRWVDPHTTTRDLCRVAGLRLLEGLGWEPKSIDAVVFVSQTPDYRLPATACLLQSDWGIQNSCIAFDVNLGCSGYPYALWLGMTMIQSGAANRVLLAVGDTISRIIDPKDRATAMVFGDAGTVTALEASESKDQSSFILGTDGRGAENLIVPRGGFKEIKETLDPRMVGKDPFCLYMDGGEIFNFTLRAVPLLISNTLRFAHQDITSYDAFLLHQANLFMIKHLTKKARLPIERVPINIDSYGNTSCASLPLLMTTNLRSRLSDTSLRLAMFGFGVGYSWASVSLSVGPLQTVETIEI